MSIITFLAKNTFNRVDVIGLMSWVGFAANGYYWWSAGACVFFFVASVILRIVSEELRQRSEARRPN